MKKWWCFCVLVVLAGQSAAYDGATSELSHMAGGALLAGAITTACSNSENRAWIGFTVGMAASVLTEGYQVSQGAKVSSSLLDVASHAVGSALGAWGTHRYLLMPVVRQDYVGVVFQRDF